MGVCFLTGFLQGYFHYVFEISVGFCRAKNTDQNGYHLGTSVINPVVSMIFIFNAYFKCEFKRRLFDAYQGVDTKFLSTNTLE